MILFREPACFITCTTFRRHYQLSKVQIRSWLNLYGKVYGDVMMEEAIKDEIDKSFKGSGTYLAEVEMTKRLPNLIPMFGIRVMLSHKGIKKKL
jgi:hypothetical protein